MVPPGLGSAAVTLSKVVVAVTGLGLALMEEIVGGVAEFPILKLAMAVPQLAARLVSDVANSLAAQKLPSFGSTVMPLKSPARYGAPSNPVYTAWPACTRTGVSICPAGSDARRPVTYTDRYSLAEDST